MPTLTLPEGGTQKVLVPQVYVRVRPGDIDGNGALLSGNRVNLQFIGCGGDLTIEAARTQSDAQTSHAHGGSEHMSLEASSQIEGLSRSSLSAQSIALQSGRDMTLSAVDASAGQMQIDAGGTLRLEAPVTTVKSSSQESDGDAWNVSASGHRLSQDSANYNRLDVGTLTVHAAGGVQAQVGMGQNLQMLAQQPGMGWTTAEGAPWQQVLIHNVGDRVAGALVSTALNGGDLERNLGNAIATGLLDTVASTSANWIGGATSGNALANAIAHAVAGCVVGAGRAAAGAGTSTGSGCSAGALGAVVGELMASGVNPDGDPSLANYTINASQLMAGIAGALVSGNQAGANIAGQAGANAAANNYLSHSPYAAVRKLVSKENARLTAECGSECTAEDFRRIDAQMQRLEAAAQYLETQKRSQLTTEQAVALGENIAALLPVYGTPIALYQALTGESLSGKDLSAVEQVFNGVAAALPIGSAAYKLISSFVTDMHVASSVGGIASDGTMLMDFRSLTTQQKGVIGELLGATTVQNALPDATRLGRIGEVGSRGIDDLYKVSSDSADYVIVEYKFGTSTLGNTADGVQMSDEWVLGSERLINATGSREEALKIEAAMRAGRVEKWVVHTDPAGGTSVWVVDSGGRIVKANTETTSKILGSKK